MIKLMVGYLWRLVNNPYAWSISVLLSAFWFYRSYVAPLQFFKRLGVPGPTAFPLIGTVLADFSKNGAQETQIIQVKKYGKIYGIFMGSRPCYMVADLNLIQQILIKEFSKFPNRTVFFNSPKLAISILNLQDGHWKRVRTALNPTFTTSKMKQMLPIMRKFVDILLAKMERVTDTDESIDLWLWLQQLTVDIIAASALGTKCEAQSGSYNRFTDSAAAIFRINPVVMILSLITPKLFPLLITLDRSFSSSFNYIEKIAQNIVNQRRQEGVTECNYKDLLQLMIDASNNDDKTLTDEEIVAQSMSFLLAGYETSSNCMSFTAYLLATNPEIQEKLIKKVREVCGGDEIITYDMLGNIDYLDMVIKESLRIYPPGYLLVRESKTTYQYGNYIFPKGTPILVPVYAIHHDSDIWPRPDRFDPERFTKEASDTRHSCAFLPFGAGPRSCIGMRFAIMEIKLTFVKILRRFKFVVCPETEIPLSISASATLSPKNGVRLRIKSIKV